MFARPNGKFIIAERIEEEKEETTKSGLFVVANTPSNNLPRAKVLAVGNGFFGPDGALHPIPLKEGDIVMYGFNCDIPFEHEDKSYIIINFDAVMAIFNE